jgi:hypothetical protein
MADFATDRLEPTSRGTPVSAQDQREIVSKPGNRPRLQPRKPSTLDQDAETAEQPDDGSHRLDQLA